MIKGGGKPQSTLPDRSGILLSVGFFSGVINVLALAGSLYMLQIYDRVLPSRSIPTLVALSVLMAAVLAVNGVLDFVRVRIMSRAGVKIDNALRGRVLSAVLMGALSQRQSGGGLQPIRDLDQIRGFLSGLGTIALFDLPWVPVYIFAIFLLHPLLGAFAVIGALLLVYMAAVTEAKSRRPLDDAARSASERIAFGEAARRNAEVTRAMGLDHHLQRRWFEINAVHLAHQLTAADAVTGMSTFSKTFRLLLQSGILGLGAYLVIHDTLSAGVIVAASIIMSRALAPIDMSIAHWRGFVAARQSYSRLKELLQALDAAQHTDVFKLPPPRQTLVVEALTVVPPGTDKAVLESVAFTLAAGEGLGIVGPSASGKSTLARALVGVWAPQRGGAVRLDGASLDQWDPETLGRHIGYLPQSIELLAGTVAENIGRFDPAAPSEAIVEAAKTAGVHDFIVRLPGGYRTEVGEGGARLSAGQRQRIALARALYGNPFLVVLDEPNSNLDHEGDTALTQAILSVRRRGGIAIVIAHRAPALAAVDRILALANGRVQAFGPKDQLVSPSQRMSAPAGTSLRLVPEPPGASS